MDLWNPTHLVYKSAILFKERYLIKTTRIMIAGWLGSITYLVSRKFFFTIVNYQFFRTSDIFKCVISIRFVYL